MIIFKNYLSRLPCKLNYLIDVSDYIGHKNRFKMVKNTVVEKLANSKSVAKNKDLQEFVRIFYANCDQVELAELNARELVKQAESVFEFIKKREPNKPKIEISNPKDQEKRPRSHLLVLNDDKPFLVDSVNAELSSYGLKIHQIYHPVYNVRRDKNGKFLSFSDKGSPESLIFVEITYVHPEKSAPALVKNMEDALHGLYLAVEDWREMVVKVKQIAASLKYAKSKAPNDEILESEDFVGWLADNHFTFLSYVEYETNADGESEIVKNSKLGIARAVESSDLVCPKAVKHLATSKQLLEITKSDQKAIVHRNVYMDQIGIKKFNSEGEVIGQAWVAGLFASSAYYQSTDLIPFIRRKVEHILNGSGLPQDSHMSKIAKFILDSYPRDEIFQSSLENLLQNVLAIVDLIKRPRVGTFLRRDKFERFMTCLIYVPKEKFDTTLRYRLQNIIETSLDGKVTEYYTQISDSPLSRLYLTIVPNKKSGFPNFDEAALKTKIVEAANIWADSLQGSLFGEFGEVAGEALYAKYENAFSKPYQAIYKANNAVHDIKKLEECLKSKRLEVEIYKTKGENSELKLKLFNPLEQKTLSEILPVLENAGLRVIEEKPFTLQAAGVDHPLYLREFEVEASNDQEIDIAAVKEVFEEALERILNGEIENDSLNRLSLFENLQWRDVALLRAYTKYLKQVNTATNLEIARDALANYSDLAAGLVSLFYAYFDTDTKKRDAMCAEKIEKDLVHGLRKVENLNEDLIIRRLLELMQASLRTNFFQPDADGYYKSYISFKIRSSEVSFMPKPVPFAEIFVYSPETEGVHLRGEAVARGGLRWSDRGEDFRTEVLGLMKAQMVKNAVIVPSGSKGGFYCKKPLPADREARQNAGIASYKTFLYGLLDITDNLVNGKVVPPVSVVRRDSDDPYLVVAADKGTATFSDIANGISQEYGFWLDDAFASGGSAGYDHKAMAITARGAWVSVERHFRELGMDTRKEDFTVAGIGDMAGDVFGNGMLLSEHIKLVAAFNHMHIFIDPNPNPKTSFEERKRMFALPRSSWEDYNEAYIAKGGGIFSRAAKTISLNKEICEVLGISTKTKELSPNALIKAILLAPVDLLWNGGIGTYVKARVESDSMVGDKANDALRVNGGELRCRVIGEGGNLGLTQLGRIEFAHNGGKINTDAIDNSAGVDCSDHEVNIKIAFAKAIEDKKLNLKDRNKLLEEMTEDVAKLVLRDNYLQTQAISIAQQQSAELIEAQHSIIKKLEKEGKLNREIEFLPTDDEFDERKARKQGLMRPKLAVLLSYAKIDLYQKILSSHLPDEEYYSQDLLLYFPEKMQTKFKKYIETHQLRREIIATFVTNSLINRTNSTFVHSINKETGMEACDIARAYTVARDAFGLRDLWKEIEALDGKIEFEVQARMLISISAFIESMTLWYLRNLPQPLKVDEAIAIFAADIAEFKKSLSSVVGKNIQEKIAERVKSYTDTGVPEELATNISNLNVMASACDVALVAKQGKMPLKTVAKVYFEIGQSLSLGWLRDETSELKADNYWERLALKNVITALYEQQRRIASHVIKTACKAEKGEIKCDDAVTAWHEQNAKEIERHIRMIEELHTGKDLTISMLVSAVRRTESLNQSE